MIDVAGFIKKAAEKSGFVRERYDDRKIPTDASNICVVPFFGDLRSLFVLSSILLNRYREEDKGSKYFIFCSWPGFQALFPYVDEYWGIQDEQSVRKLYANASQFRNKNNLAGSYYRNLNQYFFEDVVMPHEQFLPYYKDGITDEFWKKYHQVRRFLPAVPSAAVLGKDFGRELASKGGFKVFVYPSQNLTAWRFNDVIQTPIGKEFWVVLVRRLLRERFVPVVYKGLLTHDVSSEFTDKCLYVAEQDFGKVLSSMRASGCVLDIFSGISRMALAARCPFVSVDEHNRWAALKEYEIDDLCSPGLPKQYIFSFPTIIEGGGPDTWDFNILNSVIARLHAFLPDLDRDNWPSTGESTEVVPYEAVRKKKAKRIGTKLLKVPKD
jgi:hypothetical protein